MYKKSTLHLLKIVLLSVEKKKAHKKKQDDFNGFFILFL
jgi:hypothetical protein